jgi:hypothetical protein
MAGLLYWLKRAVVSTSLRGHVVRNLVLWQLENKAFRNTTPRQNGGQGNTGAELVLDVFFYSLPCPY